MPSVQNLRKSYAGLNPAVQSIRVWLFPGPPFNYDQPPAIVPVLQIEVSVDQAHFIIYEGFTGKNGTGTNLGRGHMDTGDQTVKEFYKASDIETILEAAFPAPGAD